MSTQFAPALRPKSSIAPGGAAPLVAVLLCTANGETYLPQQLDSIRNQTHRNLRLVISDDGSKDGTLSVIRQFQASHGAPPLELRSGPKAGFSANFMSLACDPSIDAAYYAFSDQDDIWLPEKLTRAIDWLQGVDASVPAMYCGRTQAIDEAGRKLGLSPLFAKDPSFKNAIVQSLAGGNTIVLNRAARDLVVSVGLVEVVAHDWWFYQLISGVDGLVLYDSEPTVQYRQHSSNIIGSNSGWKARALRVRGLFKGRFQSWNDINLQALEQVRARLTPENQRVLTQFRGIRESGLLSRLFKLQSSGIHRQTLLGNLGLLAAAMIKKI